MKQDNIEQQILIPKNIQESCVKKHEIFQSCFKKYGTFLGYHCARATEQACATFQKIIQLVHVINMIYKDWRLSLS